MENAADALKIAFAIFVLITALTITFLLKLISTYKKKLDYALKSGILLKNNSLCKQ